MFKSMFRGLACLILTSSLLLQAQTTQLCEPWQKPYTNSDAHGKHVIGLWPFIDQQDASNHGLHAKLDGAVIVPDTKFGACLETFTNAPDATTRHAALIANHPALSPQGAFTLEMWIKPKPEIVNSAAVFLADKKYVYHTGYQFTLGAPDKSGKRSLYMSLGFGVDSEIYESDASTYASNVWTHLAFTYDGEGTGHFYRDGATLGGNLRAGRGWVAANQNELSIGDRNGSLYDAFPGYIAQVRLCQGVREFRAAKIIHAAERNVFVRMEKIPPLVFSVVNLQNQPMHGALALFSLNGQEIQRVALPDLAAGAQHDITLPFDTTLKPDDYQLQAQLVLTSAHTYKNSDSFAFTIVPRKPKRMPVVLWGLAHAEAVTQEMPRLKEIGFTHCLGFDANSGAIFQAGHPTTDTTTPNVKNTKKMLNLALANDVGIIASLSPGAWVAKNKKEFRRVDKDGKPSDENPLLCAAFPEMSDFCYNVGASVAQTYGAFPAWQAAMLHTEIRDSANICWHKHDREAYRVQTGAEYPQNTINKAGVNYKTIKDFPRDRVVPDDHPLLKFLSWYWKDGDGWNRLNSRLDQGLKSTGRQDVWTFHDPAVRVASVYGSGGAIDVISQWTYSYPDPIRIGVATDELCAMARGATRPQNVMKMTQIIWYRSQTAPLAPGDEIKKATTSPWEDTDADAAFPTIAPIHLREAFWTKLARPIQGIMYHGWGSLVPQTTRTAYRYTHPQTQHELKRLIKEVVEPLGPTLLQIPDRPSDVAFLESFASQMFARRGMYGWAQGWSGDAYQILMWAQLQPVVVYDETIIKEGLDNYRLLVLMDCDVLTAQVAAQIKAFQKNGGLVVGDERLCPAIQADIVMHSYERTRQADKDRTALLAKAEKLRKILEGQYTHYTASKNLNVITRCRAYGSTDYLFAVNDQREFGDYVGQYGLVMENGLASQTTLSLERAEGYVYDLVTSRPIATTLSNARLQIQREFGPGEGCVLMVTDKAINQVQLTTPTIVQQGQALTCHLKVVDADQQPIDAVIPVQLTICDPAGSRAEWSGFYGAKNGQLEVQLDLASNDRPGQWQIHARELAAGHEATAYFRVTAKK